MPVLELDRVTLSFGGLTVLNEVSFAVEPAQLFALIGPNGAGKTSIFNCISGIYAPRGNIRFGSRDIVGLRPHEVARLGIARTFQHGEIFPQMSVLDNLLTARHGLIRTNPISEMLRSSNVRRIEEKHRARVDELLYFMELERYRAAIVGDMPFGFQKIVGFARALAAEPKLLLTDEPSAGLSRGEREDLAYFMMKIKDEIGIAIVWVEHDMQMVADLADRVHVLDYGRSLSEGSPGAVLNDAEVIKAYLGTT